MIQPRLLITDDDRDFRETLGQAFEQRGFGTLLAEDGCEAVQIAHQESVHVVLIDMHMPKLTGLEAIEQIHAFDENLPCILISAALDDEIRNQANDAFSMLEKPVNFKQVNETVDRALHAAWGWSRN